jgi:hypothetical protein
MKPEELSTKLRDASESVVPEMIHNIAISWASHIAAIDNDSAKVAEFIERRLAPFAIPCRTERGARDALERMYKIGS